MKAFLSGNEGGDLILPPAWKEELKESTVRNSPAHNIRAGIGYLLMRTAIFECRSVLGADSEEYEVIVRLGDNLSKIAKEQESTVDTLKRLNDLTGPNPILHSGQVLKYQKASVLRVITGWRPISTMWVAARYNTKDISGYARKLDHALLLIRQGKAAPCIQ